MEEIISKEELGKIEKIEGEVRGAILKADVKFILQNKGKEGLEKVEREMEKIGYPFRYREVKALEFYPVKLRVLSLLAIKKVLGFSDKQVKEIGRQVPQDSFILRLSLGFLGLAREPEKLYKNATVLWKRFLTIGEFVAVEFQEKAGRGKVIDRLMDFNTHPILCIYLEGILERFHEIARRVKKVNVKETKCIFKGDEYHEFLVEW